MDNSVLATELKTLLERAQVDRKAASSAFERAIRTAVVETVMTCLNQVSYLLSLVPSESDGGARADKPHGELSRGLS